MTPRGTPRSLTVNAVLWSLRGLAMHRSAGLLRVSAQAGLPWSRNLAKDSSEKPAPTGSTIGPQLDAMGHSLKTKRPQRWCWSARERATRQWRDWAWGRRDQATFKRRVNRLASWDVKLYYPDQGATQASVMPQEKLVQRKTTTHDMERNHGRQRPWFGRFTRRSIIISKAKEMVDLPMPCARGSGAMGIRMYSYHYLIETFENRY